MLLVWPMKPSISMHLHQGLTLGFFSQFCNNKKTRLDDHFRTSKKTQLWLCESVMKRWTTRHHGKYAQMATTKRNLHADKVFFILQLQEESSECIRKIFVCAVLVANSTYAWRQLLMPYSLEQLQLLHSFKNRAATNWPMSLSLWKRCIRRNSTFFPNISMRVQRPSTTAKQHGGKFLIMKKGSIIHHKY